MKVIGLDGFRQGWVAVTLQEDRRAIDFPADVSWLATQTFDRIAIDIPVGLSDDGVRACDSLARARLSPHGSRIFSGARRWLWEEFRDPDAANSRAEQLGQKKVSRQLWHLGPKIGQVDAFVRANRHFDIRETHPELVFLRLNDGVPLASKHTTKGLDRRCELLDRAGFTELETWLTRTRMGKGAQRDDVLDACAAAVAARDILFRVPDGIPPLDAWGLPMQIWY